MSEDLKSRTAKGVGWGFAENVLSSVILAVANIVLARMLTTEDFGIISMTAIFITLSTSLVDSGFANALIRRKEVSSTDLDTVFYFNVAVSILLYTVLFFCAPLIASFFRQEILVPIVRILSLSLVFNAFGNVHKVLLIRNIDFKTQAGVSFISSTAGSVAGIVSAVAGMGIWSLVILQLVRFSVNSLFLWIFSEWHPGFKFSFASLREMFGFGSRLMLTSILSTLWSEMYSFIIGKVYSPNILGLYSRAEKVKAMFTLNIGMVMQRVSYPALSMVQDDRERQLNVYRKVFKTTVLLSFTAILGLWAVSGPFILTVYGEKWFPAVRYLRILCFSGMFVPLMLSCTNVINADGRSDITFRLEIIKTLAGLLPVILGIFISVEALLWSMIAVSVAVYAVHAVYVSRVIHYTLYSQFKDIFPIFLSAMVMALIVNTLNLLNLQPWLLLVIQILTGGAVTVFIYEFIYRCEEYRDMKKEIFNSFLKVLHKC